MGKNKTARDHMYAKADVPLKEWIFMMHSTCDKRIMDAIEHLIYTCGIINIETIQLLKGVREQILIKLIQLFRI